MPLSDGSLDNSYEPTAISRAVTDVDPENLPPECELAIIHSPPKVREALRVFFWFDQRLGRIVGQATEPMLAQMRLAWWRDMLRSPVDQRPEGDVVLDGISKYWPSHEAALVACVDGWERLLDDPPLTEEGALEFARGRAATFKTLAKIHASGAETSDAGQAAQTWALVDAALHVHSEDEREMLFNLARATTASTKLPKVMRGLAVLEALSARSLNRGGQPLMEGRGAAIVAMRAAIFGR